MSYKDVQVSINGVGLLATTASINENYSLSDITSLGTQAAGYSLWADAPKRGTASFSYYLKSSDASIRNLTGLVSVDGYIGNVKFNDGFLTSYSISAEPFSLIQANVTFDFFGGIEEASTSASFDTTGNFKLIKGEETTAIDGVGFNSKLLSYSYSITQSVEPVYKLGDSAPTSYNRTQGKIQISIQGTGLADAVTWPCQTEVDSSIDFASTCGNSFSIATSDLLVESLSIEGSVDNDIVGAVSLMKNF